MTQRKNEREVHPNSDEGFLGQGVGCEVSAPPPHLCSLRSQRGPSAAEDNLQRGRPISVIMKTTEDGQV